MKNKVINRLKHNQQVFNFKDQLLRFIDFYYSNFPVANPDYKNLGAFCKEVESKMELLALEQDPHCWLPEDRMVVLAYEGFKSILITSMDLCLSLDKNLKQEEKDD